MFISTTIVPDELKIAKAISIYKKDNPEVLSNYRPVSVLRGFSKILERLVFGFRCNPSTYMEILEFLELED